MPTAVPLLVVISAPSGAGKTTLCERLLGKRAEFTRAITCTTRAPRPGEREGIDYYFVEPQDFAAKVASGEFLEHAMVHGNRYGTLRREVLARLDSGRDVLLNIDVQGAATVRAAAAADPRFKQSLVTVFLTPATFPELERRLRNRGTDAEEVIRRRLVAARLEIGEWHRFDYLILSRTADEDLRRLETIIDAERMRVGREQPPEL